MLHAFGLPLPGDQEEAVDAVREILRQWVDGHYQTWRKNQVIAAALEAAEIDVDRGLRVERLSVEPEGRRDAE